MTGNFIVYALIDPRTDEARYGKRRVWTPETKAKISAAKKAYYAARRGPS